MGLDMWLEYKNPKTNEFEDEIMYWRKAYAIRNWFTNNLEHFEDNGDTKLNKEIFLKFMGDMLLAIHGKKSVGDLFPSLAEFDREIINTLIVTYEKLTPYMLNYSDEWFENLYYTEWY